MDISRKCAHFVLPVWALLMADQSLADIYKCQQPDGSVKFSDVVCADGKAETIVLLENSPLDSTAERKNIARYNGQELQAAQRKSASQIPQVLLITDSYTEERNARVAGKAKSQKKKKPKSKKRRQKSAAVKTAAMES